MMSSPFLWSSSVFIPGVVFILVSFPSLKELSLICVVSLSMGPMSFSLSIMIDSLASMFILVVGFVGLFVFFYSLMYMESEIMKRSFMIWMLLFFMSMITLSLSSDLFWVMVGWDGLGLSSFFLILFYQNWKSFNSGMVTFLCNRLGDLLLLLAIIWSVGVSMSFYSMSPLSSMTIFMVFAACSKSAQIPFSAWLPLAMAAPTPVSSLVHSSTLVTAGVYLLLRFYSFLSNFDKMALYVLSLFSIVTAGISSLSETDLKKVVALSTMSHVGLMMMFISLGNLESVMVHMSVHALFKSLLFMICGELIHSNDGSQDIRKVSISDFSFVLGVSLVVSLLSMTGAPFLSGFLSKEMFLLFLSFHGKEAFSLLVFYLSVTFTASYSFRILIFLTVNPAKESRSSDGISYVMLPSLAVSCLLSGGIVMSSWKEGLEGCASIYTKSMKESVFLLIFLGGGLGFMVWLARSSSLTSVPIDWLLKLYLSPQKGFFTLSYFTFLKSDVKGSLDYLLLSNLAYCKLLNQSFKQCFLVSPLLLPLLGSELAFLIFVLNSK